LNTSGGIVVSVASATSPTGANLIGAPGWSFTVPSTTQLTVVHPLGSNLLGAFSTGIGNTQTITRAFAGTSTIQYAMIQNIAFTQVDFWALSAANAGYATSGTSTLTIFMFALV
jgi:hypothetical protein